jgi:NAD(P)-dependent dehydrogenase (short-subunit alcohol dehydrogenase family)
MTAHGFREKRVVITGGARGIGLAAAEHFAAMGASVVINDISAQALAQATAELDGRGLPVRGVLGSVADRAGCEDIVKNSVELLGGIDILVNSAGVYRQGPSSSFSEEEWDLTLDVNLKGTFFTSMIAMPHLENSGGNIVNLASEAGLRGARLSAVYCASKGGVVLLTKALALEFAPAVRVNCVCPSAVDTRMMGRVAEASGAAEAYMAAMRASYPLKRIAQPSEIAAAIAYLASPSAANVTGTALAIDAGSTAGH